MWCGFFVFNGSLVLLIVLYVLDWVWMFYNGLLVYVMMGVLFVGEWLVWWWVKVVYVYG